MISLQYKGKIYNIEVEPFETMIDAYKRAWYIVKNYDSYSYKNLNELYSLSIIMNNKNKGMNY